MEQRLMGQTAEAREPPGEARRAGDEEVCKRGDKGGDGRGEARLERSYAERALAL